PHRRARRMGRADEDSAQAGTRPPLRGWSSEPTSRCPRVPTRRGPVEWRRGGRSTLRSPHRHHHRLELAEKNEGLSGPSVKPPEKREKGGGGRPWGGPRGPPPPRPKNGKSGRRPPSSRAPGPTHFCPEDPRQEQPATTPRPKRKKPPPPRDAP